MDFFDKFCDPNTIHQLTLSQKMISSLIVTALGMGVTFVGLIAIQFMMQITSRVVKSIEDRINKPVVIDRTQQVAPKPAAEPRLEEIQRIATESGSEEITEELIAVITAAIAATLGTHASGIVVSNIRRVDNNTPMWAMAGRTEQLNSRF